MPRKFKWNLQETAGALGDYGTLLPIILGVALTTDMELGPMLFFFGLAYILTGLYYRLPVPVEPMKAIGALAIAGTLSSGSILVAGFFTGLFLLIISWKGWIQRIKRLIPLAIIRGLQLGLGLTLLFTAGSFMISDPWVGFTAMSIIIIFSLKRLPNISALIVIFFGLVWGLSQFGFPGVFFLSFPLLSLPSLGDLGTGFFQGAFPQIPITLANSILATSLLIKDLFNENVPEQKLTVSVGLISLIPPLFGGFPMCHGAGGLAAQYRFGARTGASNIISGSFLLFLALFFASPQTIQLFPIGILGALLFFSGIQLGKSALKTDNIPVTAIAGVFGFFHLALGFILALAFYWAQKWLKNNYPWRR